MSNSDDQAIGEMRAELRALMRMFEQHNEEEIRWRQDLTAKLKDYSGRVRVLERWRDVLVGIGLAVTAVWGVIKAGLAALFVAGR